MRGAEVFVMEVLEQDASREICNDRVATRADYLGILGSRTQKSNRNM
jgi:hypothetical protein